MHTMTLYSNPNCAQSHRVRIVLGENDLVFNVVDVNYGENNEDLVALNPNNSTPTFVDRNLVLYESRVIMEYLDERFPHPPLMPVDPVVRAKTRMVLHYIEKDLYGLLDDIKSTGEKKSSSAKEKLKDTNPQHRLVQPSEIASVVAFACGETCPALTNEDIQINAGALW